MGSDLTPHEIELLEVMDCRREPTCGWGAWVTVALESLHGRGFAEIESEDGVSTWRITPAGRAALSNGDTNADT